MPYQIIPVTAFEQNCSLIWCNSTRQAAIVDPGGDLERIHAAIEQQQVTPSMILLTHAHIDHAGGTADLAQALELPIIGPHKEDKFWIDALPAQGQMFGFPPAKPFNPARWLVDGDEITLGELQIQVKFCPGHTPGHVVFYIPSEDLLVVGDVLFKGSIGRTDFPKGDHDTLIGSIRQQLWPLDDTTQFIPGHGPMSTIGEEKRSNPYLQD